MHNVPLRPADVLFAVAFGFALGLLVAAGVPA
jgi:hypothetical protein